MNNMISVIVPVYNVEKYLVRCLNSISKQTFNDFESILVDDGSLDSSGTICDEFAKKDNRFQVVHCINGGLSAARNVGLKIAKGEYICFVDSDDWIKENLLENLLKILEEYQTDIAVCGFFSDEAADLDEKDEITSYYKKEYMLDLLDDKLPSYFCGKLFKRELFYNQFFPEGKTFEDLFFMPNIINNANKIVVTNQKYYFYFSKRPDNITNLPSNKVKNQVAVAEAFRLRYEIANTEYKEAESRVLKRATLSSMYAYSLLRNAKYISEKSDKDLQANYQFIKEHIYEIKANELIPTWYKVAAALMLKHPKLFCKLIGVVIK